MDKSLQTIYKAIGILEGKVEEGFKGIHKRQDITNGNIIENSRRIKVIENSRVTGSDIQEIKVCLNKIEEEQDEHEKYINSVRGALIVISVMMPIASGIIIFLIQKLIEGKLF